MGIQLIWVCHKRSEGGVVSLLRKCRESGRQYDIQGSFIDGDSGLEVHTKLFTLGLSDSVNDSQSYMGFLPLFMYPDYCHRVMALSPARAP